MKTNIIKSFCFLAAVCLMLTGCEEKFGEGVTLTDIQTGEDIRVNLSDKVKAQAWPVPWDCTDYKFTWESADPTIATVDNYGKISPQDVGKTVVSVSQGSIKRDIAVEVYETTLLERLEALGCKDMWLFEDADNLFKATAGKDLTPVGTGFTQVAGSYKRDKAVRVEKYSHFLCDHGIAVSGDWVTTYTIMIDFSLPEAKRACFMQTALDNTTDVDFFLRGNMTEIGVVGAYTDLSKTSFGKIEANKWYRLMLVVELGAKTTYYLNGVNIGEKELALDNRIAMSKNGVLLFADEDGEDETIDVASVAIWGKTLTEAEVKTLGGGVILSEP